MSRRTSTANGSLVIAGPLLLILLWILGLVGCSGQLPTAPTIAPPLPAEPVCRDIFHPETRETKAILVNGQLAFVTIITPAWTERVC